MAKLGGIANTLDDRIKIQKAFDRLEQWAESNKMNFSRSRRKVLQLILKNQLLLFKMGWFVVLAECKCNVGQQCHLAAKRMYCNLMLS